MIGSKRELAAKIQSHELTECHQLMQQLIRKCIESARVRNDTADGFEIYRNQGAVKELKHLLKSICSHEVRRGFDGGFGE
ncbi:MAG: hypothetical protein KAV87_64635 [Desulfobacteraceae bacterium]|nr:hypothetical protein [Desulfobacteraceae bacterium]